MRCQDIMKKELECVSPTSTVQSAAERMRDQKIGFLPVCDSSRKVLGTLTDRDLAIRVLAGGHASNTPVEDVMTREIVCCRPEDDLRTAEDLMGRNQKSRIMCLDANGHLVPVIPVKELREQFHRTEAPMKACIERSGQHATGNATLNFTVAERNHKLVIDTTGVQDEETLAGYPELLECMHRTANVLTLEGHPVPDLGTGIYVRRHVRVENGVLVEDSIFNFSYYP